MDSSHTDITIVDIILMPVALAIIAFLIGYDANKKGRCGVAWGLLCFFTCAIAIPIYFLLTSKDQEK